MSKIEISFQELLTVLRHSTRNIEPVGSREPGKKVANEFIFALNKNRYIDARELKEAFWAINPELREFGNLRVSPYWSPE
jgi:hypothetical protein